MVPTCRGGRVIAVDTNPAKLQLATKLGATDLVNPNDADPVEQVKELTKGGVHHSIECLGLKKTAEQAFEMLGAGGTATIVGMVPFGEKIELHGFDFLRERKIQGSIMGSNRFRVDMPRLIELYMQGACTRTTGSLTASNSKTSTKASKR